MSIIGGIGAGLSSITSGMPGPGIETGGEATGAGGAFGQILQDLTAASQTGDRGIQDLAVGGSADLHDVALSMQMESLSFDLAIQIRNKLVDAYQEIFRMQV
jgi:flagellar hook-basal body complex protein FliE